MSRKTERQALVGNAADAEQVERATKRVKTREQQRIADLQEVLETPAGRRFLWSLLEQANPFASVYSPDALAMAYAAGRQDYGHYLIDRITAADPDAWIRMQQEAAKAERNEAPTPESQKSTEEPE